MSDPADGGAPVPVTRVELRRASLVEICRADEVIRSCALLRSLAPAEAERLLGGSVARRYQDGAAVYREGDEGCAAHFVLRGEVRLSSGRNVVFAVARKGDVFGEAELVTQKPARASTATAAGDADVVELPAPLLMEVGRGNPQLVELIRQLHFGRHSATREIAEFINRW
ncbi:MAG TPA: cyclic nucleotide-binding domain-containing protein [Myxococcaceae bacterium]|nr:cyclic nucleotide-binding domain-containing protein [Myxococcaceae bacterium]